MKANEKTSLLNGRLYQRGIDITYDEAHTLRRASMTLRSWYERECGGLEQDEDTGKYYERHPMTGRRWPVANLEAGAIKRILKVCSDNQIDYYLQTDCRGASLYVSNEVLTCQNYDRGVCCEI